MRRKLTWMLGIAMAAVIAISATALATAPSPTHNVEPMQYGCKLSPAGMQKAKDLQTAVQQGKLSPQQLIAAVCTP